MLNIGRILMMVLCHRIQLYLPWSWFAAQTTCHLSVSGTHRRQCFILHGTNNRKDVISPFCSLSELDYNLKSFFGCIKLFIDLHFAAQTCEASESSSLEG